MPANQVLSWPDGRGWVVLCGAAGVDSDLHALALVRLDADGDTVCLDLGDGSPEQLLADLEYLGAPPGYLVDLAAEDDETIRARLSAAALIAVASSGSPVAVKSSLFGPAEEGMRAAHANGAVLLFQGSVSAALGQWVLGDDGRASSALGWVERALILPGETALSNHQSVQVLLRQHQDALALAIGPTSALALGPDGQVELWGDRQVAVLLGPGYRR